MGRRKIHLTPEERTLAARRYRAAYYEKNRSTINKQLVKKRQNTIVNKPPTKRPTALGQPRQGASALLSRRAGRPRRNMGEYNQTMARSEHQFWDALKQIIGRSLREHMKNLCKQFILSGDYKDINDTHSAVQHIETEIGKLRFTESHSVDLGGQLYNAVGTIVRVVEDLLLNAMEGTDVGALEGRGLLLYQVVPDVILE